MLSGQTTVSLLGTQAGGNATLTVHDNIFVGFRAGYSITGGAQSIANGRQALYNTTTLSECNVATRSSFIFITEDSDGTIVLL